MFSHSLERDAGGMGSRSVAAAENSAAPNPRSTLWYRARFSMGSHPPYRPDREFFLMFLAHGAARGAGRRVRFGRQAGAPRACCDAIHRAMTVVIAELRRLTAGAGGNAPASGRGGDELFAPFAHPRALRWAVHLDCESRRLIGVRRGAGFFENAGPVGTCSQPRIASGATRRAHSGAA